MGASGGFGVDCAIGGDEDRCGEWFSAFDDCAGDENASGLRRREVAGVEGMMVEGVGGSECSMEGAGDWVMLRSGAVRVDLRVGRVVVMVERVRTADCAVVVAWVDFRGAGFLLVVVVGMLGSRAGTGFRERRGRDMAGIDGDERIYLWWWWWWRWWR